jgi:hypothetical protein
LKVFSPSPLSLFYFLKIECDNPFQPSKGSSLRGFSLRTAARLHRRVRRRTARLSRRIAASS